MGQKNVTAGLKIGLIHGANICERLKSKADRLIVFSRLHVDIMRGAFPAAYS